MHNDLKRYKNVTQEVLKNLKKLVTGYSTLNDNFAIKNKLFDFITKAESIDINYELRMTKEFTLESVTNLVNKINDYANKAEEKITVISGDIERIVSEIQ